MLACVGGRFTTSIMRFDAVRRAAARSDDAGSAQLARELAPIGYAVQAVEMRGCLHLKPACTYLGGGGSHLREPDLQRVPECLAVSHSRSIRGRDLGSDAGSGAGVGGITAKRDPFELRPYLARYQPDRPQQARNRRLRRAAPCSAGPGSASAS